MAIAVVATWDGWHAAGTGSAVSASQDTTGASLIEVSVGSFASGSAPSVADSKGNTWVPLTFTGSGIATRFQKFYCLCSDAGKNGPGHTITVTATNGFVVCFARAYSGFLEFHSQAVASQSGVTSLSTGSVTPPSAPALVTSAICLNTAVTSLAATSPLSLIDSISFSGGSNMGGAFADQIQATPATHNPAWTWTGSSAVSGSTACYIEGDPPQIEGSFVAGVNTTVKVSRGVAWGLDGNTNVHSEAGVHKTFGALSATQYIEAEEMAAAPSGVSNKARIYAIDNGSGKTQLVVIFGSGAAQVIATEP